MNEKTDMNSMDSIHAHIEKLVAAALTDGFVTKRSEAPSVESQSERAWTPTKPKCCSTLGCRS